MRSFFCGRSGRWARAAVLLLVLANAIFAEADLRREFFEPSRWHSFGADSGLPPGPVRQVVDLPDGTAWARTASGVYWYDGYRWQPAPGLPRTPPVHLIAYGRSRLVVRLDSGIYFGGTNGFDKLPAPAGPVHNIGVLNDRTIFAYTGSEFVELTSSGWRKWAGPLPRLPANYFDGAVAYHQIPLAGAPQLLGEFGAALARLARQESPDHPALGLISISRLAMNARGEGVASVIHPMEGAGIWEWGPDLPPVLRLPTESKAESLSISENGEALVQLSSMAAYARQRGKWHLIDPVPGVFQTLQYIRSRPGGFWFSDDDGLHLFWRAAFLWETVLDPAESAGSVTQMIQRADGSWWIAAEAGLVIRAPDGQVTIHRHAGTESLRGLTSLVEDGQGHIWVSSGRNFPGAFRWDGRDWKHFDDKDGLGAGPVHRMYVDRKKGVWFLATGTLFPSKTKAGGAWCYDNGKFKRIGVEEGLPSKQVYAMAEAADGTLWFAGNRFLSRFSRGVWAHQAVVFPGTTGVFSVTTDSEGRPWFADRLHGVATLDREGRQITYTTLQGLTSNEVYELRSIGDTIWISTRSGFSALRNGRIHRFGSTTGLKDIRLWPTVQDRRGRICVGGSSGGVYCLSREFERWPAPRILVEPPSQNNRSISLRWNAASFWGRTPQSQLETRYRVDEQPWSEWRSQQKDWVLQYAVAGDHRVDLQARSAFGEASSVTVPFRIEPPYYRRAEFQIPLLASLLAIAVLAGVASRRRREYRRQIESSEKRFRALIENSSDCIMLYDRDWTITYASPSIRRITGYEPEELIGQKALHWYNAEDLVETGRRRAIVNQSPGALIPHRLRVKHKDGQEIWIEGTTCNLLDEPSIRAIVANSRNITERVRSEEALKEARSQAEQASRAKSSFLASMSHEIRTPMNGILGMTDLLSATQLNADQREGFEIIHKSAKALLHIINDVLDLSRIEAGAVKLENSPFSPRELVTDVQNLLGHSAREKGVHLETVWQSRTPAMLCGDAMRLRQILLNLTGNAIKFTEKGAVSLKASVSEIGAGRAMLRIAVCDSGIGIAADQLTAIFGKFAQADATTTRRYGGSGLGLAITKSMVELMGGTIAVQSEPGTGSEFTIQIPLDIEQQPQPLPAPVEPNYTLHPLSGMVLVVEDNKVNQLVAAKMLARLGCRSESAFNGREALSMLQSRSYDLVLMDCHMPEMDGYEATRQIRAEEKGGRRLPVIAMTASVMPEAQKACAEAGMDGFISKPVGIMELHTALAPFVSGPTRAKPETQLVG